MMAAPDPSPSISVVVMGYRNRATIVESVKSVVAQESPEPFEVIVVTSGGDDSAALIRERLPGLTVIESPRRLFPGATRNAGVAATEAPLVAFLAADCLATPGWVSGRLAAHAQGYRAVAGAVGVVPGAGPWAWASHYDLFCARLPGRRAGVVRGPDPAANVSSFTRDLLEELGPFDESVETGEDTVAAAKCKDLCVDIWFEPSVLSLHRGPTSTVALVRDHVARHRSEARVRARGIPPPVRPSAFLPAFLRGWLRGLSRRTRLAWHNGGGERWRVLVSLPWFALARGVGLWTWERESRALGRRSWR
jgi:glycosyltransferase involved in cell wall biosynthesis